MWKRRLSVVATVVMLVLAGGGVAARGQTPNVLLIMADDMGWGDAHFNGGPPARTPHLDAMAAAGLTFNRFYAAAPVCSPTRGSVLTGRHPHRYGIYYANVGHLPEDEPNLAQMLKSRGYTTGHFGKWHLGTLTTDVRDANRGGRPNQTQHYAPPWERGFDVCFSTEAKVPTFNPLIKPEHTRRGVEQLTDDSFYGTRYWNEGGQSVTSDMLGPNAKVMTDRLVTFMGDAVQRETPFFAVVWYHEPHRPIVAGEEHRAPFGALSPDEQEYWGCILAMDEQIGRIRAELRRLGVAENTIIFFASDNGPEGPAGQIGSTGGLRGRKRDLYEGGVRVPGIIEWPGRIAPGETDFAAVTTDYVPTLAELLDLELPENRPLDGVSLVPVFEDRTRTRAQPIGFESAGMIAAVGQRYKVIDTSGRGTGPWAKDDGWNLELYDLLADPGETRDLAAEQPEVVAEMRAWLEQWQRSMRADQTRRSAENQ